MALQLLCRVQHLPADTPGGLITAVKCIRHIIMPLPGDFSILYLHHLTPSYQSEEKLLSEERWERRREWRERGFVCSVASGNRRKQQRISYYVTDLLWSVMVFALDRIIYTAESSSQLSSSGSGPAMSMYKSELSVTQQLPSSILTQQGGVKVFYRTSLSFFKANLYCNV